MVLRWLQSLYSNSTHLSELDILAPVDQPRVPVNSIGSSPAEDEWNMSMPLRSPSHANRLPPTRTRRRGVVTHTKYVCMSGMSLKNLCFTDENNPCRYDPHTGALAHAMLLCPRRSAKLPSNSSADHRSPNHACTCRHRKVR